MVRLEETTTAVRKRFLLFESLAIKLIRTERSLKYLHTAVFITALTYPCI